MAESKFTVYRLGYVGDPDLESEKAELAKVGARHVLVPLFETEDETIEQARDADGLIIANSPISRRVLEALDRCKVALRLGVGVDTIDVDAATDLGVAVVNVPDLWVREVANHALTLLLACNRRLTHGDRMVRRGEYDPSITSHVGGLHGETLGLVGLGNISRAMARRAVAFEMDLIAYDPYLEADVFAEHGVTAVSFEELLARSDYVSIHCPSTDETHHLFDEAALRQMKPTAYLVNTACGPIVSEAALVRALEEGWIAGAGLDVFDPEPPAADNPLLAMSNVVLTPHQGWYSDPAVAALPGRAGNEVARVLTGRMPRNLVNPAVLAKLPLKAD